MEMEEDLSRYSKENDQKNKFSLPGSQVMHTHEIKKYPSNRLPPLSFWGKFSSEGSKYLPLAAHCLDVGLVFQGLYEIEGIKRSLQSSSSSSLTDSQRDRLAVLAMFHDLGKANIGFQRKIFDPKAPRAGHIKELAPLLDQDVLDEELHERFIASLPQELAHWFLDDHNASSYFLAIFSHHGRPFRFKQEKSGNYWLARKNWWVPQGSLDPMAAIQEVTTWAKGAFPLAFEDDPTCLPEEPEFHHRFAGLIMLADWLGSHTLWFPIQTVSFKERLEQDKVAIPKLLESVGLKVSPLRPRLARRFEDFEARFLIKPRPLQSLMDDLNPQDPNTRLLIAESETGSGKTEAALNWFFKLFAEGLVDGLYFALPTRVAARELYKRVQKIIGRWFPKLGQRPVTVLAVPGYAQVDGIPLESLLPDEETGKRWHDDNELLYRDRYWAAEHPKRFLAASVAVGTIDQALLSIVQTAHAHLRSVCLDRNLFVVDEVHASNVYMSRLLECLLAHHLEAGGRALLLSATLGARARHRYTNMITLKTKSEAFPDLEDAKQAPYPAITLADGTIKAGQNSSEPSKKVRFETLPIAFCPEAIAERLCKALENGARVLVILNTVGRTNALLRALEVHPDIKPIWLFSCQDVVCPHHGRFAPEDRLVLDAQVSERFGLKSPSGPVLLVGTQTLEQSLDIDADLLVSDLAPADVLLQRVGRLHRHPRYRPAGFQTPLCLLLVPEGSLLGALDERGLVVGPYRALGYGSVYEDLRMLELTMRTLLECPEVNIPLDNRRLVEVVTHPQRLAALKEERWERHGQQVEGGELAQAIAAGHVVCQYNNYFGDLEFNEAGGKVAVRLGAKSLQISIEHPIISPFGQTLKSIVIPEHMAPVHPEELIKIEKAEEGKGGFAILRCADRRYRYSRYGLEEEV